MYSAELDQLDALCFDLSPYKTPTKQTTLYPARRSKSVSYLPEDINSAFSSLMVHTPVEGACKKRKVFAKGLEFPENSQLTGMSG
jgi:hypothetical protein